MAEPAEIRRGLFFGIGNPLLDLSKEVTSDFLQQHKVQEHQAILAGPEHEKLFDELSESGRSTSGGSSQNIMRTISWFLGKEKPVATYMGAVGDDFERNRLIEQTERAGLDVQFEIKPEANTGRCAVLINSADRGRSMVTDMGASCDFSVDFLMKKENWAKVEAAKILCSEGFFLLSCREAFMRVCEHAYKTNKLFAMTLSAAFICDDPYGVRLLSALAYADIVFGYETEAKVLVRTQLGIQTSDIKEIITAVRDVPKWNKKRQRIIVLSRVPERTIVASNEGIRIYKWKKPQTITDTHGCGAALAGGFLASMAQGKSLDQCVNVGLYCAIEILQRLGSLLPDEPKYKEIPYYKTDDDES